MHDYLFTSLLFSYTTRHQDGDADVYSGHRRDHGCIVDPHSGRSVSISKEIQTTAQRARMATHWKQLGCSVPGWDVDIQDGTEIR